MRDRRNHRYNLINRLQQRGIARLYDEGLDEGKLYHHQPSLSRLTTLVLIRIYMLFLILSILIVWLLVVRWFLG